MVRTNYTAFLLLLLILVPVTLAEEKEDADEKPVRLEKVVVEEEKIPSQPQKSEVKVDESTAPVGANPVDVLQTEAGIDVNRLSLFTPKGEMIKVRTFDTEETLVTLDGRPLNGAGVRGGYQVDLGMIQLEDIEKIEVVKGASSAEYGNTLGGVINIVPKPLAEKFQLKLTSGVKEYNTYNVNAFASARVGAFGFILGGGSLDSDGFLRNNFARRKDASPSLYYYLPGEGKLKVSLRYSDGEYGMPVENKKDNPYYDKNYPESEGSQLIGPGFGMKPGKTYGDNSYVWKARYEMDAAFNQNLMGIGLEAKLYGNYEDRVDYFYAMDKPDLIFLERRCPSDTSWGWALKAGKELPEHKIKVGVEGNYMGYEGTENRSYDMNYLTQEPQDSPDQHNISIVNSAFAQDSWAILSNLDVYLGLRVDDYKGNGKDETTKIVKDTTFSPKFGIYFSPIPEIDTFATAARATKFPSVPKYYWYFGGYQPEKDGIKRKDLTYEDGLQYEIGGNYRGIRNTEIFLKGYYYDVENYLRWIFGYKPSRVVYNLDYVKITGFEFEVRSALYKGLYGFANYTWQRTKKEGDILDKSNMSDRLGEIPENKFNLGLQYQSNNGAFAKLTLKCVDEREIPIDASKIGELGKMDSYALLNGLVKYPLFQKRMLIYAGCENILGTDYQETYGYPMPGRMFYVGCELNY